MGLVKTLQVHEEKGLTSTQNSTLQVPAGGRITSLMLEFKKGDGTSASEAEIRAEIGNIRLTIGGTDIVNSPVNKILDLYEVLGNNVAENLGVDGVVELNIGRLVYLDPNMRDACGFGTADVNSIQIQVVAGTLTSITSVQAFTRRQAVVQNLGTHCRFIQYPQSYNAAGTDTVDSLPRSINSAYLMAMVDDGVNGEISHGECRLNSSTITERCPTNINKGVMSHDRYVQPDGYFVHTFVDGATDTHLPMSNATDFRILSTFSTAPGADGYNICALTLVDYPKA